MRAMLLSKDVYCNANFSFKTLKLTHFICSDNVEQSKHFGRLNIVLNEQIILNEQVKIILCQPVLGVKHLEVL